MEPIETVRAFYDANVEAEWNRIADQPEFLLTARFLDRYVKKGDRVLDIGGGPGRYSLYLAEKGCEVTLFDLSEENVRFAAREAAARGLTLRTVCGDAREADRLVAEGGFDCVLLMGPLYHLLEETGREAAVRAACRLLASQETVPLRRQILQKSYYLAACQLLPEPPQWGALAGVRPTKLTTRHLLAGGSAKSARELMEKTYFVSPERSRLCVDASLATVAAAQKLRPGDLSVYIGIPFCPTRCSYCSFVSQSIERCGSQLEDYLQALLREIAHTGQLLAKSGCRVRTLYIGGGTPTTLSTPQLDRLMSAISRHFDLSDCLEYTVEGGRPDTLDAEKLACIHSHGCDRISINPQTMNESVLAAIGRCHTAQQTLEAYELARRAGFPGINMDLIAGLPGDSCESFEQSLRQILALDASNITVHTLALKKGAALYRDRTALPAAQDVAQMLWQADALLRAEGYVPYYLYRQKYMSGSFENIGWCRPGFEGLYNIYMMEELHSIVSLGGGGMSKLNLPGGRIERFHNPKQPSQYIERLEQTLAQKDRLFAALRRAAVVNG